MRTALVILASALFPVVAHAQDVRSVADLLRQLGDPDWARREEAQAELLSRGPAIRTELAADSGIPDAEVQARIASLLDALPPADPFERFVWETPYESSGESPHPLPVPPVVAEAVRHMNRTDALALLTEYGLAVHWKNLQFTGLARELPLENALLAEWIRLADVGHCGSAQGGGWLDRQFEGRSDFACWSSFQVYTWARVRASDLTPRARWIVRAIEDSGLSAPGGSGVCHYGCR